MSGKWLLLLWVVLAIGAQLLAGAVPVCGRPATRKEDEMGKVTQYQKVLLTNVEKIEFGNPESSFNLSFGRNQTKNEHSMRIFYKMPSEGT